LEKIAETWTLTQKVLTTIGLEKNPITLAVFVPAGVLKNACRWYRYALKQLAYSAGSIFACVSL
jgi:hypothetical protein